MVIFLHMYKLLRMKKKDTIICVILKKTKYNIFGGKNRNLNLI